MGVLLSCWSYSRHKKSRHKTTIPFKESIDLVGLPIVTFTNNGEKLHFLLDTGSDDSHIVPTVLNKLLIINKQDSDNPIITAGGSIQSVGDVTLGITYKNHTFINTFKVSDMEDVFKEAFGDKGIVVHGILGSIFFNKYNYILDFEELQATSKYGHKG
jgi:hypothetical protein